MPTWKKAGNPVVSTVSNLKQHYDQDIPAVVVDLRNHGAAEKGHIKGAVSITLQKIENAKHRFPAAKSAPVILYAEDTETAMKAFRTVRGWGYKNTSVLSGGFDAWKTAKGPTTKGKLATEIVYVPKPRPGEIPIAEFKTVVESLPKNMYILDVRDEDEAMQGMLNGANNISSQELAYRLDEIPKDKEIIIHCITGVRAEMAYVTLKEKGFKSRFLNATISIDADGKYEIVHN